MPAEMQIYRPDYVKHHFIHYSTVTERSILNRQDTVKQGLEWVSGSAFPDPLSRFGDEVNEGKSIEFYAALRLGDCWRLMSVPLSFFQR